jgi:hypothetical protein
VIALSYAHAHRVPYLSVNTCVHELLHLLLQDVFVKRPKWFQANEREMRDDWYATGLWLFTMAQRFVNRQPFILIGYAPQGDDFTNRLHGLHRALVTIELAGFSLGSDTHHSTGAPSPQSHLADSRHL